MVVLFLKSFQTIWCQEDTFFNRDKMVSPEVMVSKPVMVEKPVLLETQYDVNDGDPGIYEKLAIFLYVRELLCNRYTSLTINWTR